MVPCGVRVSLLLAVQRHFIFQSSHKDHRLKNDFTKTNTELTPVSNIGSEEKFVSQLNDDHTCFKFYESRIMEILLLCARGITSLTSIPLHK